MSYTVDLEQLEDEELLWSILETLGKKLNRKGKECIFLVSGKNNEAVMSWATELGGYFLSTYPKWSSMFQDFCCTGEMPTMEQLLSPGEFANKNTTLNNVEPQFKTTSIKSLSELKNICKWLQGKDNSMFPVKEIKIKEEGALHSEVIKHSYKDIDVKIEDNSQHSDEMTDCNTSYSNVQIEDCIQGSIETGGEMTNFNTVRSNVLTEDNIQGSIGDGGKMTNFNTICSNVLNEDNIEFVNEFTGRWKEHNKLCSNVLKEKLKDIILKRTHLNNSLDNCTFRNVSTSKGETDQSYVANENNIETVTMVTDQQGADNSQNKDKKRKKGSGGSQRKYQKRKKSTPVPYKCVPILQKKIDDNTCTVKYFRYGGIIQNSTSKEPCEPLMTEEITTTDAVNRLMDKTMKQNSTTKETDFPLAKIVKYIPEARNHSIDKTSMNDEKWKMSPTMEPLSLSTVVFTKIVGSKFPTKEEGTKNFVKENMMIHVPPEILADQVVSDSFTSCLDTHDISASSNTTSCLDILDISTGNSASCYDVSESSLQKNMNCSLVKGKANDFADNHDYHDNKGNNHTDTQIESLPNATEKDSGKNDNEYGFQLNQELEEEKRILVISEKETAHTYNKSKICKFCSMKFSNTFWYHQHLNSFHRSKFNTKCVHCDVIFKSSTSLRNHMTIHIPSNEMPYRCDVCGKGLFTEKSLKQHSCALKVKNRPQFMCEICGKIYHSTDTLAVHKRNYHTESSVRTNRCGNCRTRFFSRLKLNIHESACKPQEPCDVFQQTCRACGQYFKEQSALNVHIKEAHPFLCFICGKNLKFAVSFDNHMKRHKRDQQFPCKLCSAKYYEKNLLDVHIKNTHGQASSYADSTDGSDDFRIAGYYQGCKILKVS
ncbi:KRAB [Mytilus edulis]|uniref:KRAB n=1 Tax=Mytilus edulis TaxID=6550 RepID=A0A8S3TVP3_MYTED|nr:KRAB [Mytilus edulis]